MQYLIKFVRCLHDVCTTFVLYLYNVCTSYFQQKTTSTLIHILTFSYIYIPTIFISNCIPTRALIPGFRRELGVALEVRNDRVENSRRRHPLRDSVVERIVVRRTSVQTRIINARLVVVVVNPRRANPRRRPRRWTRNLFSSRTMDTG